MLYFVYKIGLFILKFATLDIAYSIVSFFAKAKYALSKKDRKTVKTNLRHILPQASKKEISRLSKEVFVNFGKYLVDFFLIPEDQKEYMEKTVQFIGTENLREALKSGRGCILISAHFGNWELGGCALASFGFKINAVALEHADPRINNLFLQQRKRAGINVMHTGATATDSKNAIMRNEIIAILGDRPYRDHGIEVEFFGKKAIVPRGAALLSLRNNVPVLPTFVFKEDTSRNLYKLVIEKPFLLDKTDSYSRQLKEITHRFLSSFERYVVKYPSQWYVFSKVWGD